jgi:hypothetical protein
MGWGELADAIEVLLTDRTAVTGSRALPPAERTVIQRMLDAPAGSVG